MMRMKRVTCSGSCAKDMIALGFKPGAVYGKAAAAFAFGLKAEDGG